MRILTIIAALVFVLVFTLNSAFSQIIEIADIYIIPTPQTTPVFGGYLGGDGDWTNPTQAIDWSIGNSTLFSSTVTDDIVFSTNVGDFTNPNDWIERMRITKDGNVGIGTTTPLSQLHIESQGPISNGMRIFNTSSTGDPVIHFLVDGVFAFTLGVDNDDFNKLQISAGSTLNSNERLTIDNSGNVGIGTPSPNGKLDVNGSIYQRGGLLHADYVFEPDYKLETIEEHAEYMWNNKHLKAIPKAIVDKNGQEIVEVGSHRRGIVEELEKAHIYIEQLQNQIKKQNNQIKLFEERLAKLEARNNTGE